MPSEAAADEDDKHNKDDDNSQNVNKANNFYFSDIFLYTFLHIDLYIYTR